MRSPVALTGFLVAAGLRLGVLAGQIPVVDGVIGGGPTNVTSSITKESLNSPAVTAGALRVTENSGICESPDVYQASGYGDITNDESIW